VTWLARTSLLTCPPPGAPTGADAIESVVFHSFHLLLVSADDRGYIRVNNGVDAANLNTFHVTDGEQQWWPVRPGLHQSNCGVQCLSPQQYCPAG